MSRIGFSSSTISICLLVMTPRRLGAESQQNYEL